MRVRSVLVSLSLCVGVVVACGGSSFTADHAGGSGAAGESSTAGAAGVAAAAGTGSGKAGAAQAGDDGAAGESSADAGTGNTAGCHDDDDCAEQSSTCRPAHCDATRQRCITDDASLGTACKDSGGLVCNGGGECVAMHCADGVRDADETDLDCGGSCGPTCTASAPQQSCKTAQDCVTGSCAGQPLRCQPACASTCAGSCKSCVIPGKEGTCTNLPAGVDDAPSYCFMQATCADDGACVAAQNKGHFGDACTQDSECFNGSCGAGFCKLQNGDACAEDAACKSGRCAEHACAACASNEACTSGVCNAGSCALPGGYVCATGSDCASTQCLANKTCNLSGDTACTPQNCLTHFCKNGACQTCSTASDCPLGTPCQGGSCLAPSGSFCTSNAACASGKCAAAALLSTRKCD